MLLGGENPCLDLLGLCSYGVECSSESVQESVQVSGAMERLPALLPVLSVCYHVMKDGDLGLNWCLFSTGTAI